MEKVGVGVCLGCLSRHVGRRRLLLWHLHGHLIGGQDVLREQKKKWDSKVLANALRLHNMLHSGPKLQLSNRLKAIFTCELTCINPYDHVNGLFSKG